MRSKELLRRRRDRWDGQAKLRMRHYQDLASNWILVRLKVTVLLCHTQDQLFHGFGRILLVIHLWIIVGCIYNHIIVNILLCIQVVSLKDRLTIIWSKRILIAARRVRRMWRKIQSTYSRGGVPQAYLTLRREDCNVCATKNRWSNKWRSSQQSQQPWRKFGGRNKLFHHQLEVKASHGR